MLRTRDAVKMAAWPLTILLGVLIFGLSSDGTFKLVSDGVVAPDTPQPAPAGARIYASVPKTVALTPKTGPWQQWTPASLRIVATPDVAGTTLQSPPQSWHQTATVISGGLAMRAGPLKASRQIAALPRGEIVTVNGEQGGWLLVETSSGLSGWAYSRYLALGEKREVTVADAGAVN